MAAGELRQEIGHPNYIISLIMLSFISANKPSRCLNLQSSPFSWAVDTAPLELKYLINQIGNRQKHGNATHAMLHRLYL